MIHLLAVEQSIVVGQVYAPSRYQPVLNGLQEMRRVLLAVRGTLSLLQQHE